MKNLRTVAVWLCLVLGGSSVSAQHSDHAPLNQPDLNKPRLFSNLPDRIPVSTEYINSLFDAPTGKSVTLQSAVDPTGARFEGIVVSTASKYNETLKSVVVRATNFNGANLTVSKFLDENGAINYSGRIVSRQHGDAFVLKTEDGQLFLVKKDYYSLINE